MRVVIADDSDPFRSVVVRMMRTLKHEVVADVDDGVKAVEACAELRPDLAILDVTMVQMNGLEAAQAIRSAQTAAYILLLTSAHDATTIQMAQDLKAFRRAKPIEYVSQLRDAINGAVSLVDSP